MRRQATGIAWAAGFEVAKTLNLILGVMQVLLCAMVLFIQLLRQFPELVLTLLLAFCVALASGVWAERIGLWREVWPADSFGAVATGLRRVRSWPVQMSLRMVGGVSVIKAVIIATIWAMGSLLLLWWLKSE